MSFMLFRVKNFVAVNPATRISQKKKERRSSALPFQTPTVDWRKTYDRLRLRSRVATRPEIPLNNSAIVAGSGM